MEEKLSERPLVKKFRNAFFTGLLVLLPLAATVWILSLLYNLILGPIAHPFHVLFGNLLPSWLITLIIIKFMFYLIVGMGLLTQSIVGKAFIRALDKVFDRIPIVGSVYTAAKQVVESLTKSHSTGFRRVVLIEYPSKDIWAVAFVTREEVHTIRDVNGNEAVPGMIGVFIPTTPNPTSGYFMFLPKSKVIPLSLSIEDAMRMIISAGVLGPRA